MEVNMKKTLTIVTVLLFLLVYSDNAFACYRPKSTTKACWTKPAVNYASSQRVTSLEWKHQQQAELIEELQIKMNSLQIEVGVLKEEVKILEQRENNVDIRLNNMDSKSVNMHANMNNCKNCNNTPRWDDDNWAAKCKIKCKIKIRDEYSEQPSCPNKPRCPKMYY
jgi:hypothetical protein